jgi:hypothetical protein
VLALLAGLWLAGCGDAITLDISTRHLTFEAMAGAATPPAQTVKANFTGYAVIVGVPPGQSEPAWLDVAHASSDEKGAIFRFSIKTTSMNPATYGATLRFVTGREDGTDLEYVDLPVTYTVRPAPRPLSISPGYLSFSAVSGQTPPPTPSRVTVTTDDAQPVRYSVTASYHGSSTSGWLTLPSSGLTPQSFDVGPNTTALPAGQYNAVLTLTPDNGRPSVQISVSYGVSAPSLSSLSVSPTQLSFTASSGQLALPTARTVTVSGQSGQSVNYAVSASYGGGGPTDWLTLPPSAATPQTLELRPNTTALPPGQYSVVLSFTPDNGQPVARLTLTYSLSASELRVSPSAPMLRVDGSTLEAGLTSLVALTSAGEPLDWRVVSNNVSWLDFTSTTGNTRSDAGLNLVLRKSALAGMDNGTWSGLVTLAYGNASTPESQLDIPVTLTLAVPRVSGVTPYWSEAGRSLSHILRGEGFSTLQSGQALRFGTTTTSTYQVISDTELRLTVPALPVGAHPVSLDNALGLSRPSGTLHAVRTPAMPEVSLARTRYTKRAIYDPLRNAVYTLDYADGVMQGLFRYRHVEGTWTEEPYVTLPDMYDILMDADGQSLSLFMGSGVYTLELDDPTATPRYLRDNQGSYSSVARLNDGYVLDTGSCYHAKASLDGRRAIIMDAGCYSPRGPVRTRDAGSTEIQYTSIREMYGPPSWMSVDRTARYAVVENAIYNAQWAIVGSATDLRGTFFSEDARRLFGLYADSARSRQLLRVLDVSKPPVGGRFTQLVEVQVPGAQAEDGIYGGGMVLTTPDDRTLIFVNQRQFRVMSVPTSAQ